MSPLCTSPPVLGFSLLISFTTFSPEVGFAQPLREEKALLNIPGRELDYVIRCWHDRTNYFACRLGLARLAWEEVCRTSGSKGGCQCWDDARFRENLHPPGWTVRSCGCDAGSIRSARYVVESLGYSVLHVSLQFTCVHIKWCVMYFR